MFMVAGIYFMKQLLLFIFYPSVTQYPLEDGSVAGLLRRRRVLVGFP